MPFAASGGTMHKIAALLGLLGLGAATSVIVWSGWDQVILALSEAGWGIVLTALFHVIPFAVSAYGWRLLMPGRGGPGWWEFLYFLWIRASVNNLMPVARIGGEIAAVRVMISRGIRKNTAIGSIVVELTLSIIAMFLFVLMGVALFAVRVNDRDVLAQLAWGVVLFMPLVAVIVTVQKIGFFGLLSRLFRLMFRDKWSHVVGSAANLDRMVHAIYRRRRSAIACGVLQFAFWVLGAIEIEIALIYLGKPVPFTDALIIEALVQGAANAAFAVPGALGVQEAGFLIFGGLLGLPREVAAALTVMRRCRDLLCYVPGLVAWQIHEGRKLLRK
jgi:putative membrane protein